MGPGGVARVEPHCIQVEERDLGRNLAGLKSRAGSLILVVVLPEAELGGLMLWRDLPSSRGRSHARAGPQDYLSADRPLRARRAGLPRTEPPRRHPFRHAGPQRPGYTLARAGAPPLRGWLRFLGPGSAHLGRELEPLAFSPQAPLLPCSRFHPL